MKMRPFKELIRVEEAMDIIARSVVPMKGTEKVPTDESAGRVLSKDIKAPFNVPSFDRAAMDGYAVRAKDVFKASQYHPVVLKIIEEVYAGQVPKKAVVAGTCAKLATGAPLPHGADAIVMVEKTEEEKGRVKIFSGQHPGGDVSKIGCDMKKGEAALKRGEILAPGKVGVLAALGMTEAEVFKRPVVGIIPTGNEVVELGKRISEAKVFDINTHTISAVVKENGGLPKRYGIIEDTMAGLKGALEYLDDCDLLVFSGGSSVGERDLLVDIIKSKGEMLFHGVLVKPGKPTLFGLVKGKPVFGLPGYPTSCLSDAYLFLVPGLRRMCGLPVMVRKVRAKMGARFFSVLGRTKMLTVRLEEGIAYPVFKESETITSLSKADGFVVVGENRDILEKGEEVEVILL